MTFIQKNWTLLASICMVAMLGFFSCADEDLCEAVDCGENGQCVTGDCVCDFGYFGSNCEQYSACIADTIVCPVNSTCLDTLATTICVCDEGWYGTNCDSNDPCTDLNCGDNATCETGTGDCICNAGYEGENCGTEARAKLLGAWVQTDNCIGIDEPYISDVMITANDPVNVTRFEITNFGGLESPGISVYAIMSDATRFDIPAQATNEWNIQSITTGTYSSETNALAISYTVNGQECTAVFSRP